MNIHQLRADTTATAHLIHFNNAGASLMPDSVLNAIKNHLDLECRMGGYEAGALQKDVSSTFYSNIARLLNTSPNNIAAASNATDAYARALSSIPFKRGDVILTTNNDYNSNQFAFISLQKRFGIQLVRATDLPKGGVDVQDIAKKVKAKKPRLIAITHIPTNSGLIQDIESIGQICREQDILFLLDACQTVGQLPIDVQAIGCDFLTATCRKFLRGPRGVGFLYVSDKVLSMGLCPLFMDLNGANWVAPSQYEIISTARRFETWEFAHALLIGGAAAAQYALSVGIENIAERNALLGAHLRTGLSNIAGVRLLDEGEKKASIITIAIPEKSIITLKNVLHARHINTSISTIGAALIDFSRKGVSEALRISPHYYNTVEEIEQFLAVLKEEII
jgi:selenocysteine lyase/cysteine desulfurase